jgi:hypothetical protein
VRPADQALPFPPVRYHGAHELGRVRVAAGEVNGIGVLRPAEGGFGGEGRGLRRDGWFGRLVVWLSCQVGGELSPDEHIHTHSEPSVISVPIVFAYPRAPQQLAPPCAAPNLLRQAGLRERVAARQRHGAGEQLVGERADQGVKLHPQQPPPPRLVAAVVVGVLVSLSSGLHLFCWPVWLID